MFTKTEHQGLSDDGALLRIPEKLPDDTALFHVASCMREAWQRIHHPEWVSIINEVMETWKDREVKDGEAQIDIPYAFIDNNAFFMKLVEEEMGIRYSPDSDSEFVTEIIKRMDEIELELDEEMIEDLQCILSVAEKYYSSSKPYDACQMTRI